MLPKLLQPNGQLQLSLHQKSGSLRFCVTHRKFNGVTVRYSYHIPQINERIDRLGTANVFSTFDANSGYWQITLDENNIDKKAYFEQNGLDRYTRKPFGFNNSSAIFQR